MRPLVAWFADHPGSEDPGATWSAEVLGFDAHGEALILPDRAFHLGRLVVASEILGFSHLAPDFSKDP